MFELMGFGVLAVLVAWIYIQTQKEAQEKEIERIKSLSHEQVQLEMTKIQKEIDKYKTSHVLHLLMSVITAGVWIIIWVLVSSSNSSQRSKLEKAMDLAIKARGEVSTTGVDSGGTAEQSDGVQKIRELKSLLDDGVITEEEFNSKKEELLKLV